MYDATRGVPTLLMKPYSPECVEEEFSEVEEEATRLGALPFLFCPHSPKCVEGEFSEVGEASGPGSERSALWRATFPS